MKAQSILLVVLSGLLLAVSGRAEEPPTVEVVSPVKVQVPNDIDLVGRVECPIVEVRSRQSGFVLKVHVREGDLVKKGDLLVELDARIAQAEVDRATAALKAAETATQHTDNMLKRMRSLGDVRAVSEQELQQAEAAHRDGLARVVVARAVLDQAKLGLGFTRLEAPMDGRVGLWVAVEGNIVKENDTIVATILGKPNRVLFEGDDAVAIRLRRIAEARGKPLEKADLPVLVGLPDEPELRYAGKMDSYETRLVSDKLKLELGARFDRADVPVLPGMLVRVRILTNEPITRLAVPRAALEMKPDLPRGQAVVVVLGDKDQVERRKVQLRPMPWPEGQAVVEMGLEEADRVLTGAARNLPTGTVVVPRKPKMDEK